MRNTLRAKSLCSRFASSTFNDTGPNRWPRQPLGGSDGQKTLCGLRGARSAERSRYVSGAGSTEGQQRSESDYAFLVEHSDATQVSDFEVAWNDGAVVMGWPDGTGKTPASQAANRDKGSQEGEVGTLDFAGCPGGTFTRNYYCFYEHSNYGGRRLQFADCGYLQSLNNYGFFAQASSWVNLTRNTVYVYDQYGASLWVEQPGAKSSYVGNFANDRASYFDPRCG